MDAAEFRLAKEFIQNDIEREIDLAKAPEGALKTAGLRPGGGNFLAALGLLCYTEFGGWVKYGRLKKNGSPASRENFDLFFDDLGTGYKAFRNAGHNVYNIFRSGMAHEYMVKKSTVIKMLEKDAPAGPGIQQLSDGRFMFIVERYHIDLRHAFEDLESCRYGASGPAAP